jgi:hypothetical protein
MHSSLVHFHPIGRGLLRRHPLLHGTQDIGAANSAGR